MMLVFSLAAAIAADVSLHHSGRLLGADGSGLNGEVPLTSALYGAPSGGTPLWTESTTVPMADGFYTVQLGSDPNNPVSSGLFDRAGVWLELTAPGLPAVARVPLVAAPTAAIAHGVHTTTTTPDSCDVAGGLLYDTEVGQLMVCDGSAWSPLSSEPPAVPPSSAVFTHSAGGRYLTADWSGGSVGGTCRVLVGAVEVASGVSCDAGTTGSVDLETPVSSSWNGLGVVLQAEADDADLLTLGTLECQISAGTGSPNDVDEDCDGRWDESVTETQTVSGCASGYTCAASHNFYLPDGQRFLSDRPSTCHVASGSQVRIYSWYDSFQHIFVSLPYNRGPSCGASQCYTQAESRPSSQCSHSQTVGIVYY